MHRGINRSSLPAGGGAEDAYGALAATVLINTGTIDRVREEEEKKEATGGLTSVGRSARLAPTAHTGQ